MASDNERGHIFTERLLSLRGEKTTMFMGSSSMRNIIEKLETILQDRKTKDPKDSYVSSLYSKGNQDICDKITEEASELVDATKDGKAQVVHETADLLFHVLVLLASLDIKYATILDELTRRFGTSGIEEKNNRKK